MRSFIFKVINFVFVLILLLALVIFLFWRFGIFKKEAELDKKVLELKNKIEFVNNYPYQNLSNYLQQLPTTKIDIPQILPEEIGRQFLF